VKLRLLRTFLHAKLLGKSTAKRVFYIGFGLIAFVAFLGFLAAGKREHKRFEVVHFEDSMRIVTVSSGDSIRKSDGIHAGADEMYPDMGYDSDGWSLRGYMSSYEMKGKHIKGGMLALERFEKRKARNARGFVDTISLKALEICKGTSVPPSIVAAQAILETNFGTSRLKHVANNLFGHMYKGNYSSRGIEGYVKAYDKDKNGKLKEYKFRKYASVWWSLKHHVEMLEHNYKAWRIDADIAERERWMAALCKCKTSEMLYTDSKEASYLYAGACTWVAKDGKTSRYVAELRYIIRLYNLDKLDERWQK
jgi:flagellum-specific peptidoglycan hydrolase FlgJ